MLVGQRQHGVSLIEVMIGISIIAMVIAWGVPSFGLWIQNTHNRTAAESIQNGLQFARAEAVKRNTVVQFNLTDASGLIAWSVGCAAVSADCPATIQARPAAEGSVNARLGVSTTAIPNPPPPTQFNTAIPAGTSLPASVSFNGVGRIAPATIGTSATRIDVTNAVSSAARRYVITIGTGGEIHMCDPAVALSANPQGCA